MTELEVPGLEVPEPAETESAELSQFLVAVPMQLAAARAEPLRFGSVTARGLPSPKAMEMRWALV